MCRDMGRRPSEGMLDLEYLANLRSKAESRGRARQGVRCTAPGHVLFCWFLAVLRMMALPSVSLVQHVCDIRSTGATRIPIRWGAAPGARNFGPAWEELRGVVALRGGGDGKREAEDKDERAGGPGERGTNKEVAAAPPPPPPPLAAAAAPPPPPAGGNQVDPALAASSINTSVSMPI